MSIDTRKSYCRFCHAGCAIEVDVDTDANRIVAIRGDRDDPYYAGYTCVKGRHLHLQHHHPTRLRTSMKRDADGRLHEIPTEVALDEIAERLRTIIDAHGPRAVATYCGTATFQNGATQPVVRGFHAAIGSPSVYTSVTIDQPAKSVAPLRHGMWAAGLQPVETADVVMLIGLNPLVSTYSYPGSISFINPLVRLREQRKRGLKLIVVDPRKTETAQYADLHLPVLPGEDPVLLAGMLRVILDEGRHDRAFCDRWVDGLDALHAAVRAYDLDLVERRSGVDRDLIVTAARMFADGPRGCANSGTGPNMASHHTLTEHLVLSLNTVCGRYNRAGEVLGHFGGILNGPAVPKAQPVPPMPHVLDKGVEHRVRGLRGYRGELLTSQLPDEILTPGEGQVRALFSCGGNPVVAFPDQERTVRALRSLDLHVAIDVQVSATAELAEYVIASELCLERPDVPITIDRWFEKPYLMYTPPVLQAEGDVLAEWKVYAGIAERLGVRINLAGGPLEPGATSDDVLELSYPKSRIPLAVMRANPGGHEYPELGPVTVVDADADCSARLDVAPEGIPGELDEVRLAVAGPAALDGFDPSVHRFRMSSRRLKAVFNSSGREVEELRSKEGTSYAHMHPDDLVELGLVDGDLVEVASPSGAVRAPVKAEAGLRRGVVSMAHAWGGVPVEGTTPDPYAHGDTTGRLSSVDSAYDPLTGMPLLSAIPVAVRKLADARA